MAPVTKSDRNLLISLFNEDNIKKAKSIINQHDINLIYYDDENQETLLHAAAIEGKVDFLELFLKHGASVNVATSHGDTPMHYAALSKNRKAIHLLKNYGANINQKNKDGWTPIYMSVLTGGFHTFKELYKYGADVHAIDNGENSILHLAVLTGRIAIAQSLIADHGLDVNHVNKLGATPLFYAAQQHRKHIFNLLIDSGAHVNLEHPVDNDLVLNHGADRDNQGWPPLHLSILYKDEGAVKFLLKRGASPCMPDRDGCSPLHLAAGICSKEILDLLFEAGRYMNLNVVNKDGDTPLHIAIANGCTKVAFSLLKNGAMFHIRNNAGDNVFHTGAQNNNLDGLTLLWDNCIEYTTFEKCSNYMDVENNNFNTPLHYASYNNYSDIVRFLLERRVDPDSYDLGGFTALHFAAIKNHPYIMDELMKHDADINVANNHLITPLHIAALNGNPHTTQYLINHGADVSSYTNEFRYPIHLAMIKGDPDTIRALLDANNYTKEAQDLGGHTVLQWAVHHRKKEAAQILIEEYDADIDAVDYNGHTALHWAVHNKYADLIEYLLSKKASTDIPDLNGWTALDLVMAPGHAVFFNIFQSYESAHHVEVSGQDQEHIEL